MAKVGHLLDPGTMEVQKFTYEQNGVNVILWDTPGFGLMSEEEDEKTIRQIANECQIDLVLFCVKMTNSRWLYRADRSAIRTMTEVLGKEIWKHCLFVLTFANQVEDNLEVFSKKMALFEESVKATLINERAIEQGSDNTHCPCW